MTALRTPQVIAFWLRSLGRPHFVVLWRAYQRFRRHDGTMYAAAISYYALLAIIPLLVLLTAAFGIITRNPTRQTQVIEAIVNQVPAEVNLRRQVEEVVSDVSQVNTSVLGVLSLLSAAWVASGMFGALRRALNQIFTGAGTQSFIHGKIVDLLSLIGFSVLVLVSLAATALLQVFRGLAAPAFTRLPLDILWQMLSVLLPFIASFVLFLLVYRLVPNRAVRFSELSVGALIAAIGFELAKVGFGLYLANVGRFEAVYGALGGIATFLSFTFLVSNLVLFAAEVAAELAEKHGGAS